MRILFLVALSAASVAARAETNRQALEKQAGDIWDAAHAKTPGRALTPAQRALFERIDAVAKLRSFSHESVEKALGVKLHFTPDQEETEYTRFEAAQASTASAFGRVDLRQFKDASRGGILIVDVRGGLDVRPEDALARFGANMSVSTASDAPPGAPYSFVYKRKNGILILSFKPGTPTVLVDFGLNSDAKD
jgi:hypothetical protein